MNSNNLRGFTPQYDVAVIGAGISGLGVAREALKRGYSVIVFERAPEVALGTSANSLRIIHGGFRYLQSLSIDRVVGSINAQAHIVRSFPNLLRPLPCLMELNRFGLKSRVPVMCASGLFKVLARSLNWPPKDKLPKVVGGVEDSEILSSANNPILRWWDWQLVSHTALANVLREEIETHGAAVKVGALVTEVRNEPQGASVILETGEEVPARIVADCRGSGVPSRRVSSWAMAFNLILSKPLDSRYGVGFSAGKRLLFSVPREAGNNDSKKATGAVGTWYIAGADPFSSEKPAVTEQQIAEAIVDVNSALPSVKLTREMVIDIEAGVLPSVSEVNSNPPVLLARERIETRGRIIKVISTKYTTFETQARWALDTAADILKR